MPEDNKKLFKQPKENLIFAALTAAVFSFAAHGFAFGNLMYSHDGLIIVEDTLTRIKLGRWAGYYYIKLLRGQVASTWLVGVMMIIFISMSALLITEVFGFSRIQSAAVSAVMSVNVTLTALVATFTKDVDVYALALLFASLALFARERLPRVWNIIVPIIFTVLSLGCYQAYFSCVVLLLVLVIIKKLLQEPGAEMKPLVIDGITDIAVLGLSFLAYNVVSRIIVKINGVEFASSYNSPENLENLGLLDIFKAIPETYRYVFLHFFSRNSWNGILMVTANVLLFIILAAGVVYFVRVLKGRSVLFVILLLILPVAANTVALASQEVMHLLMLYPINLLYILPVMLQGLAKENSAEKAHQSRAAGILLYTACGLCFFIAFRSFVTANSAYVYKKLVYEATVDSLRDVWRDVNAMEGYEEGETPVVVTGSAYAPAFAYYSDLSRQVEDIIVMTPTGITYDALLPTMIHDVLGKDMYVWVDNETYIDNEQYKAMPAYPKDGYCRWIDDRIVVKLSE